MMILCISFFSTLISTLIIIRWSHNYKHIGFDSDIKAIQKFHSVPVPRIGGVGIFVGAMVANGALMFVNPSAGSFGFLMLLCGAFCFFAGLLEDLTKKIGIKERLVATAISGLLGGVVLGGWITRIDIQQLDSIIAMPIVFVLLTSLGISGVANAYNIVDGYNGLTGVISIIALLSLSYVAKQVGDIEIATTSLVFAGAIAGFLVWNFPKGLIFLGDGGAYLIGFVIAEQSVLIVVRNELVSAWFPLLLSFYPIFETIFSIYRKKIKRNISPGIPDGLHLHMLIYKRVVRWAVGTKSTKEKTTRNALTAPYLWVLSCFSTVPAVLYWANTIALQIFTVIFAVFYIIIYRKIVMMKVPGWIIIRKK